VRPAIVLFLRALAVLMAILAVMSCGTPATAPDGLARNPRATPSVVLVGASDIATCSSPATAATARVIDTIPGIVFTAGDNLADTVASYTKCFEPYWGRHMARMHVTLGNRDYDRHSDATDAFDYFGDRAGPRGRGYYSFDAGTWHVVVLNTSGHVDLATNSAQLQWLRADLATVAARNQRVRMAREISVPQPLCTVALFHRRRFFQGAWGKAESLKPLWEVLYANGVEFVVNGQDRFYERYAPQDPSGARDPVNGIRQFIVGTGGRWLEVLEQPSPNVEVRNNTTWGVMKFTLAEGSYSWQFVPAAGGTFTDSGSGTCH
jgi:acid phosphatase type 7